MKELPLRSAVQELPLGDYVCSPTAISKKKQQQFIQNTIKADWKTFENCVGFRQLCGPKSKVSKQLEIVTHVQT